jgi:hypothetical protein
MTIVMIWSMLLSVAGRERHGSDHNQGEYRRHLGNDFRGLGDQAKLISAAILLDIAKLDSVAKMHLRNAARNIDHAAAHAGRVVERKSADARADVHADARIALASMRTGLHDLSSAVAASRTEGAGR